MASPSQKTALIAGATGLVGRHCLELLLQSKRYTRVISIGRRTASIADPKLEQLIVDFDQLENYMGQLAADDVFCCLGTTIKKAGSQQNFRKVDHDYVVKLAAVTAAPPRQFLVVSAMGADAQSAIFYNRVKGEMEQALKQYPFHAIHVLQPSLLLGKRPEFRLGEQVGQVLAPVLNLAMVGPLRKYRAIQALTVARAMVFYASQDRSGFFTHPSDELARDGS